MPGVGLLTANDYLDALKGLDVQMVSHQGSKLAIKRTVDGVGDSSRENFRYRLFSTN
jgi:hypothetical protein